MSADNASLFGRTVDARAPVSWGALVWMSFAVLLAIWAVADENPHPLIAAILPASIALALWVGRPGNVVLTIENDGLVPLGTPLKIAFDSVRMIAVGGARYGDDAEILPPLPLEVHHDAGCLVIPPGTNVPLTDLHRFLISRMPARQSKPVHPSLAEYAAEQQAKFGHEKVYVIHNRELFLETWKKRRNRWVCGAILATGLVWLCLPLVLIPFVANIEPYGAWIGVGCLCILGSGLTALALRSDARTRAERQATARSGACLVIGPAGLAMVQGDIQGVLRWEEITKVTTRFSQWLRARRTSGLQIVVRGGEIMVLDVYERSPSELETLLRSYLVQPTT